MKRALAIGALSTMAASLALAAGGDKLDPRKPAEFVVGIPKGPSPTSRVDVKRRGTTDVLLPRVLRSEWLHSTGMLSVQGPPLVTAGGELVIESARGDLLWLDARGDEIARTVLGTSAAGPPTLLSDGTVVVAATSGDVVGATKTGVRFRTRLGVAAGAPAAPLPLEDGGVVVATANELAALDASGGIRARASLPERIEETTLLAMGGRVIAVAGSGSVFGWIPGREVVRLGSFGGRVEGGASAVDERTLVAVVDQIRVVTLDLDRGVAVSRTTPTIGFYLGPLAVRGNVVYAILQTPIQTFVVGIDAAGAEILRAAVSPPSSVTSLADASFQMLDHAGVIADTSGAVAFAVGDGVVGVVDPAGVVSLLQTSPCVRLRASRGSAVRGLAAVSGGLLVSCDNGTVARYGGGG